MFALGSTVTGTFGGNVDTFSINYAGGDGNDIVLTAESFEPVPEPSTRVSRALALVFLGYTQRHRFARVLRRVKMTCWPGLPQI